MAYWRDPRPTWEPEDKRPTGILTPEQRVFIHKYSGLGPPLDEETTDQAIRQRRYRIRRRVRNALLDFDNIHLLPEEDRNQIFEEFAEAHDRTEVVDDRLLHGVDLLLALLLEQINSGVIIPTIERAIASRIEGDTLQRENAVVDATATIDVEVTDRRSISDLKEQFDAIKSRLAEGDAWSEDAVTDDGDLSEAASAALENVDEEVWLQPEELEGIRRSERVTAEDWAIYARLWWHREKSRSRRAR